MNNANICNNLEINTLTPEQCAAMLADVEAYPAAARLLLRSSFAAFVQVFHYYRHGEPFTFRPFHSDMIRALEGRVFRSALPAAAPRRPEKGTPYRAGRQNASSPANKTVCKEKGPIPGGAISQKNGSPDGGCGVHVAKNLYIGMPPRFGKTQIVKYFAAWTYAVNPACNYILTSYGAELVADTSKYIRELVSCPLYRELFPGVVVDSASSASDLWRVKGGGGFRAATIDGVVTGFGAGTASRGYGGALVIDDFLKATDARSKAMKEAVIAAYTGALKSRLNSPETPIIVIAQRLAVDDLIGYIEENERDRWDFLLLKGYDEEAGKSVWEERITTAELERLRRQAPGVFAAQYQQSPVVAGGDVFKTEWWKFFDPEDAGYIYRRVYICADTAMKTGRQNDYTVLGCFGVTKDKEIHLLDMVRGKFEAPDLEKVFVNFWQKWRNGDGMRRPRVGAVYVEDKASGIGLIQAVRRRGVPVLGMRPTRDKYTRALEAVPTIAAGLLKLPNGASDPISAAVMAECEAFRQDMTHRHDDIVDMLCYGVEKASGGKGII